MIRITVPPIAEPVSLAVALSHLSIEDNSRSAEVKDCIRSARAFVEGNIRKQLMTQTIEVYLDAFPSGHIELCTNPIQSLTSIEYLDTDGQWQTMDPADYVADIISEPSRIAASDTWPTTKDQFNAVKITLVAGFGSTSVAVPHDITRAVKLLVGHFFEHPEEVITGTIARNIPLGVESLLAPYKMPRV